MNKINTIIARIVGLLVLLTLFFVFTGNAFAATSIRLQQPGTPTNQDTFNITFVALDTDSTKVITVKCYKNGPSDGAVFTAFGSPITLSAGGNTNVCQVNSGVMNEGNGTYKFYVTATGGSTDPVSTQATPVSVDFNNSTPGTPVNYNKTKPDNCTYKISFRSANDSGKTVKVVLYRSTDTNFSVDSGHQVSSTNIGSDTDGSMTNNVSPNCDTTYYYVIRAFDVYGNGSGVVGDSNVTTTTVNPTTTTPIQSGQGQGAIPVGGQAGSVLGEGTKAGAEKAVLGTESAKPTTTPSAAAKVSQNPVAQSANWVFTHKKISLLVLVVLGAIAFYLYRRFRKRVE